MKPAVALVGIGCRFPGGVADADGFWRTLAAGRDVTGPIPASRLDAARFHDPVPGTPGRMTTLRGGYLDDIAGFDAAFFGLSPREAEQIDPQQRVLLECAWEALEDAGQDALALAGSATGVFVGQWTSDYEARLFGDVDTLDFSTTNGTGRYATSGRISYALGLQGPSLTLDTACSSSLVAVLIAARSVAAGECDLALAGGANVILQPQIHIAYSQGGMMAPDGRCKFGDAARDGYVRSEGAGLVVLKRLADAIADGDRIHAVIRGGAMNNDGRSSGSMGRPSASAQAALLRAALTDAGVAADDVGYVEAHGTGTRAGDPVEIGALGEVFGEGRAGPLLLGSVKTNFGHTEAAAGVAGLIKAALIVARGEIPASLHLTEPDPAIAFGHSEIVAARRAWPESAGRRLAGVTSFGISGTNCHLLIEEPPARAVMPAGARDAPALLVLSARAPLALRALARRHADRLTAEIAPRDLCWTAATARAALDHRAAFVAADRADLAAQLRAFADGAGAPAAEAIVAAHGPRIAFVMPGQGSQSAGMAAALLAAEPAFAAAIDRCDAAARDHVDWSIRAELEGGAEALFLRPERIDRLLPVLAAVSIAYAALLAEWGVMPAAVVGHSMGEIAAAHVAGALPLADAMRLICRRAALLVPVAGQGTMAYVELPPAQAATCIAPFGGRLSIAGSNATGSTNISGPRDALLALLAAVTRDGVFGRMIAIDIASHGAQMDAPAAALEAEFGDLRPQPETLPFYSTVLADRAAGGTLDAGYWRRNLRDPVLFADTVARMARDGITDFVELGAHPILAPAIARTLPGRVPVELGRRGADGRAAILAAAADLWTRGATIDWRRVLTPGDLIALPLYPWQRRRHWATAADMPAAIASAPAAPAPAEADDRLYRIEWTREDPPRAATPPRRWLIAAARGEDGDALGAALQAAGDIARCVDLAELETALATDLATTASAATRVLIVADGASDAAWRPVRALQAIVAAGGAGIELGLLTRGAQPVGGGRVDAWQAAAWGAARVVADEHPELAVAMLDADPAVTVAAAASALAPLLRAAEPGSACAVRGGARWSPRLVRDRAADHAAPPWRTDASYLVTGGLGDVGLALAGAMVAAGARRLILAGRTSLPARAAWAQVAPDSRAGERIAAVRALEAAGAAVHLVTVDVSDEAALRTVLRRHVAEGWPPIRGVVHAAGTMANRLAATMDRATFDGVLAAKLGGALLLDRLLPELDMPELDIFVLVSSIAGTVPFAGQANYAAANAGLDALAADRVARGRSALSIAWSAWAGRGMMRTPAGKIVTAELARDGLRPLAPQRAATLFAAMAGEQGHRLAADIDWPVFRARHDAALFAGMGERGMPLAPDAPRPVEDVVRAALGQVMRIAPAAIDPDRPLGAMGLTSLMAMELRNRLESGLGVRLPATLAYNYPTLGALVAHLGSPPPPLPADAPQAPADGSDSIAAELMRELANSPR